MPRYVILEHTGTPEYKPGLHWDIMLEADGRLRTWELASLPLSGTAVPALPLADHRLDYLDYEGPVSGNRGMVRQWDRGDYKLIAETAHVIVLEMGGDVLRGQLTLARDPLEPVCWSLTFTPLSSGEHRDFPGS